MRFGGLLKEVIKEHGSGVLEEDYLYGILTDKGLNTDRDISYAERAIIKELCKKGDLAKLCSSKKPRNKELVFRDVLNEYVYGRGLQESLVSDVLSELAIAIGFVANRDEWQSKGLGKIVAAGNTSPNASVASPPAPKVGPTALPAGNYPAGHTQASQVKKTVRGKTIKWLLASVCIILLMAISYSYIKPRLNPPPQKLSFDDREMLTGNYSLTNDDGTVSTAAIYYDEYSGEYTLTVYSGYAPYTTRIAITEGRIEAGELGVGTASFDKITQEIIIVLNKGDNQCVLSKYL